MTSIPNNTLNKIKSFYSIHSKSEFEAIFRYPLYDNKSKKHINNSFDLQAYIICPLVLDIDEDYYSKDNFYRDLKAMVRLRQPKLNFEELMGRDASTPIGYITKILDEPEFDKMPKTIDQAIDEAKLFGVAFNRHIYRSVRKKCQKIRKPDETEPGIVGSLLKQVVDILDKGETALKEWSLLVEKIDKNSNVNDPRFLDITSAVEEYCYYVYVDSCAYIENLLSSNPLLNSNKKSKSRARKELSSEKYKFLVEKVRDKSAAPLQVACSKFSYPKGSEPDYKARQNYGLRRGALKKNIQSVLYLNARNQRFFAISKQLGAMLAAGIAAGWAITMELAIIFKTGFGGFSGNGFGLSTLVLISAFIFAYILKDRIKELGRKRFRRGVFFKIPDNRNMITYSTTYGQSMNIGRLDESMEYISYEKLSPKIKEVINRNRMFSLDVKRTILSYHKLFSINAKSLRKHDNKLTSAHDIVRYNISRFLPFFDEPAETVDGYFSSEETGKWSIPKSYYFDIAFVCQLGSSKTTFTETCEVVRVFANKKGISRVKRL